MIRQRKDSWPPSAPSVLRWLAAIVAAGLASVGGWLFMDWQEGRLLLASTEATAVRAEEQAAKNGHALDELDEHDRVTDLAIQEISLSLRRLTDISAKHDEDIDTLQRRRRR